MIGYNNQRDFFDGIYNSYMDYLRLYYFFNAGSTEGATPFDFFYWTHAYLYRRSNLAEEAGVSR